MTTRMISPDGGATHAYGQGDIERLEKLGWRREVPVESPVSSEGDEHLKLLKSAISTEIPPIVEKRKPGRPAKAK